MKRLALLAAVCAVSLAGCEKRGDAPAADSAAPTAADSISISNAGAAGETATDTATVKGTHISLLTTDGGCVARIAKAGSGESAQQTLALSPKAPCYFVRRNSADPQTMQYADAHVNALVIIVGSAASDETRKSYSVNPTAFCGTETQALLFRDEGIMSTKTVRRQTFVCKDVGVDEKEFWAFAHDDK